MLWGSIFAGVMGILGILALLGFLFMSGFFGRLKRFYKSWDPKLVFMSITFVQTLASLKSIKLKWYEPSDITHHYSTLLYKSCRTPEFSLILTATTAANLSPNLFSPVRVCTLVPHKFLFIFSMKTLFKRPYNNIK